MALKALRVSMVTVPTMAATILIWSYFLLTCLTHLERNINLMMEKGNGLQLNEANLDIVVHENENVKTLQKNVKQSHLSLMQ